MGGSSKWICSNIDVTRISCIGVAIHAIFEMQVMSALPIFFDSSSPKNLVGSQDLRQMSICSVQVPKAVQVLKARDQQTV